MSEFTGEVRGYGSPRARRINGPIILIVLATLGWAILVGALTEKLTRGSRGHQHTAECWDD